MTHVDGKINKGEVILYALSTCIWCKKTRKLLEELGVAYDYEYVDLLPPAEQEKYEARIVEATGRSGYPTVFYRGQAVTGYRPEEIKALLGL